MAKRPGYGYWLLVGSLVVLTFLTAFSPFSIPCLVLAVTLACLWPVWGRPRLYWGILGAVLGAVVVLALATWGGCTTSVSSSSSSDVPPVITTSCSHLLGIDSGWGWAGAIAAAGAAGGGAGLVLATLRRPRRA